MDSKANVGILQRHFGAVKLGNSRILLKANRTMNGYDGRSCATVTRRAAEPQGLRPSILTVLGLTSTLAADAAWLADLHPIRGPRPQPGPLDFKVGNSHA